MRRSRARFRADSCRRAGGQATDIAITAHELLKTRRIIAEIYERTTHKPIEGIMRDLERDLYMTAAEALDYGLIDRVLDGSNRA